MKPVLLALMLVAVPALSQETRVEFDPKVGVVGAQIHLKTAPPPGAQVRFAGRTLAPARDATGNPVVLVPPGSTTSFIEFVQGGKVVGKSAVPFVVSGTSLAMPPKLIGLKEAIDVFGYAESRPEGGERPEASARPVLKFDDDAILTIGEPSPPRFMPAVELGDAASFATRGMGTPGLLLTARPPKKKLTPAAATPTPQ